VEKFVKAAGSPDPLTITVRSGSRIVLMPPAKTPEEALALIRQHVGHAVVRVGTTQCGGEAPRGVTPTGPAPQAGQRSASALPAPRAWPRRKSGGSETRYRRAPRTWTPDPIPRMLRQRAAAGTVPAEPRLRVQLEDRNHCRGVERAVLC
jgi:hypothetical protein